MARGSNAKQYKPGQRRANFRDERFSPERMAWLRTYVGQFVINWKEGALDGGTDLEGESVEAATPTIQLLLTRPGGRPVIYNLTSLTRDELDKTRQFFNLLFDLAEPLVDIRDKVAQDAADQGDDSYVRSYRQNAELIVRTRSLGSDSPLLRQRLESLLGGSVSEGGGEREHAPDSDDSSDGGLRGDGDGLAPEVPSGSGTEDDVTSPD